MHFRLFLTEPFAVSFRALLQALATEITLIFTPDSPKFTILSDNTELTLLLKNMFTNSEISASSPFLLKFEGKPLIDELLFFQDADCSIVLSQPTAEKPCLVLNFFEKESDFSENEKEAEKIIKVIYLKGPACESDFELLAILNAQLSIQDSHKMEFLFPHKNSISEVIAMANCEDEAVELQIVESEGKRTFIIDQVGGSVEISYQQLGRDDEITCKIMGEALIKMVRQGDMILRALGLSWGGCLIVCADRVVVQLTWEGGNDMLVQSVICGMSETSEPE